MPSQEEKTAIVISSAAAIAAAVALLKSKAASAGAPTTDEALMELLVAIAQNSSSELSLTEQILDRMGQSGGMQNGYPPNANTFLTGTLVCTVANQPYNIIPAYQIPDDFSLNLKSHPNNGAGTLIYLGDSAGNCTNLTSAWPLMPNESVVYKIKTTDLIWASTNVAGAVLCYTLEYNG